MTEIIYGNNDVAIDNDTSQNLSYESLFGPPELHYIRSLDDIMLYSNFNIVKFLNKNKPKKIFDIPGVSPYILQIGLEYPNSELHLLDKNKNCINAMRYIVTGDSDFLANIDYRYRLQAIKSRSTLEPISDKLSELSSRVFYYNDDLSADLSYFNKNEFDFSMVNYVFQYMPIKKFAKALINLGNITGKFLLITRIAEDFREKPIKAVLDSYEIELFADNSLSNSLMTYTKSIVLSEKRLSDFLGMKAKFFFSDGPSISFDKCEWTNLNVIAKRVNKH